MDIHKVKWFYVHIKGGYYMSINFGYARVSTSEQTADRQITELLKYVTDERYIYVDNASGTTSDRPDLYALKRAIRKGDHLYIHELDRLGRTKEVIKQELEYFRDEGVIVHFLDVPTTMIQFNEYGKFEKNILELVNTLLIEVLTVQAEQEYIRTKKRRTEGILEAKKRGVKFGRPRFNYPEEMNTWYKEWKSGQITAVAFMKRLNLSSSGFYKIIKRYEEERMF
jgi:resolvase/recombinase